MGMPVISLRWDNNKLYDINVSYFGGSLVMINALIRVTIKG